MGTWPVSVDSTGRSGKGTELVVAMELWDRAGARCCCGTSGTLVAEGSAEGGGNDDRMKSSFPDDG